MKFEFLQRKFTLSAGYVGQIKC